MENALLNKVVESFEKSSSYRNEKEKRWRRYYEMYRSRAKPTDDKYRANLFVPEVFTIVETLLPRLVGGFLNSRSSPIEVLGREEKDIPKAKVAQMLISYQLERMNFPLHLVTFYKQALLYGTSVGKVYWDYRTTKSPTGETIVAYDDPVFEVLDLFDFFIDPDAWDIDNARYCIHRKYLSIEELKQRQRAGIYKNVDKVKDPATTNIEAEPSCPSTYMQERNIEILEYWEDDRVVVVADRSVILRDAPNPFYHGKKPFVHIVFVPVPFEFYGIGVIEPIEGLQHELNTKRNQRLDNVNLILNRMWLVQRGTLDDYRQLQSRPGGVIVVNDINGIHPLPSPDVTSSSYMEEEKIKRDIQNTTGVTEYIRGVMPIEKQTATEVRIKSEQSSTRFDFNFKLMTEMGIKRIARFILQLDQQFITRERSIRIAGRKGVEFKRVSPEDIMGNFDLIPNIDPERVRQTLRREELLRLYSILARDPHINPKPLLEEILKAFDVKNIKEILSTKQNQFQPLYTQ